MSLSDYDACGIAEGWIECDDEEKVREAWQHLVDTGLAWRLQGSTGRMAASLLESGFIQFPKKRTTDYYGNVIPIRKEATK